MTVLFLFSGQLIAFARATETAEGSELLESGSKLCKYYDLLLPAVARTLLSLSLHRGSVHHHRRHVPLRADLRPLGDQ